MNTIKMQIQNFNQTLIDDNENITIIDYVKQLNEQFYNIDILFIDDFLTLVDKYECCIHHDMLYKYGVLNEHDTSHVKRLFEHYKFIENVHYVTNPEDGGFKKGYKQQITYMLNPDAFKKCLIRSLKTDKYADYFLLLEKCIKYYNEYHATQCVPAQSLRPGNLLPHGYQVDLLDDHSQGKSSLMP